MQLEELDLQRPGRAKSVWSRRHRRQSAGCQPAQRAVPIPLPSGLGLEGAGRVAAVGAGVSSLQVGDGSATPPARWAPMPVRGCFRTGWCGFRTPSQRRRGSGPVQGHHGPVPAQEDHRPGSPGLHGADLWRAAGRWAVDVRLGKPSGGPGAGRGLQAGSVAGRASGCDPSLSLTRRPWSQVMQATQGRKVDVVYDPIGKDTLPPRWTACVPAG
jgi:NADPH2:quinone reductase